MTDHHPDIDDKLELALPGDAALVALLGAAGSGKSTTARRFGHPVVSSDACRAAISGNPADQSVTPQAVALMHQRLRDFCAQRVTVIADATHTGSAHRAAGVAIARDHDMPAVAVVVDTPLRVCIARQATRAEPAVPTDVVVKQHDAVTAAVPELRDEGFSRVYLLRRGHLTEAPPPLALRLAFARVQAGYTQQAVSDRTGIARTALSAFEHGKQVVSADHLALLAQCYARPVGWFVGETPATVTATGHCLDLAGLTAHQRELVRRFVAFLRQDQLHEVTR